MLLAIMLGTILAPTIALVLVIAHDAWLDRKPQSVRRFTPLLIPTPPPAELGPDDDTWLELDAH